MSAEAPARPSGTQSAARRGGAPGGRDPYFSNAKVILITLVVIGHSLSPIAEADHAPQLNPIVRACYMMLYDLHMPAFVLICGYFSKRFSARPGQLYKLVSTVGVPYVVFSVLYGVGKIWWEDEFDPSVIEPYFLLWFLAALFVWRLTAPIWRMVRFPVIVATLISLASSAMDLSGVMDLSRILQFLPFFVAGLVMRREHFELFKQPVVRVVGPILCLGLFALALRFGGDLQIDWIYFTAGARDLEVGTLAGVGVKAVLLIAAAILIVTFFAFVPGRRLPLSQYGDLTMYPYLLHGFFMKSAEDGYGLYDIAFWDSGKGALVLVCAAIVLATVLFSKPVRWLTKPLIEPNLAWILKKPPKPPSPHPQLP